MTSPSSTRPLSAALVCALLLGALLACATTPPAPQAAPAQPAPVQPAPAQSTPAQPVPSQPESAQPAVYKPGPAPVQTPGAAQPVAQAAAPECASVDDCATTHYEEGACCAMLCAPRATTKKALQEKAKENCATLVRCAQPLCHQSKLPYQLACLEGRCVMKLSSVPMQPQQ
jgi:hypothetical protein